MDNIKFPVIVIGKKSYSVRTKEQNFNTCTSLALKKGTIKNLRIIDSEGIGYKVESAKKIKTILHIPSLIFFNPLLKVEYKFNDKTVKHNLNDIKEIIINALDKDLFMFESMWDYNKDNLKKRIKEAKTIKEVMNLLVEEAGLNK